MTPPGPESKFPAIDAIRDPQRRCETYLELFRTHLARTVSECQRGEADARHPPLGRIIVHVCTSDTVPLVVSRRAVPVFVYELLRLCPARPLRLFQRGTPEGGVAGATTDCAIPEEHLRAVAEYVLEVVQGPRALSFNEALAVLRSRIAQIYAARGHYVEAAAILESVGAEAGTVAGTAAAELMANEGLTERTPSSPAAASAPPVSGAGSWAQLVDVSSFAACMDPFLIHVRIASLYLDAWEEECWERQPRGSGETAAEWLRRAQYHATKARTCETMESSAWSAASTESAETPETDAWLQRLEEVLRKSGGDAAMACGATVAHARVADYRGDFLRAGRGYLTALFGIENAHQRWVHWTQAQEERHVESVESRMRAMRGRLSPAEASSTSASPPRHEEEATAWERRAADAAYHPWLMRHLLRRAANAIALAPAGAQRSHLLHVLIGSDALRRYAADASDQSVDARFPLDVFMALCRHRRMRLPSASSTGSSADRPQLRYFVDEFLFPHQRGEWLHRALLEHNIAALSLVYNNIGFAELQRHAAVHRHHEASDAVGASASVQGAEESAERVAACMIAEGRLPAATPGRSGAEAASAASDDTEDTGPYIDQADERIYFRPSRPHQVFVAAADDALAGHPGGLLDGTTGDTAAEREVASSALDRQPRSLASWQIDAVCQATHRIAQRIARLCPHLIADDAGRSGGHI
ncbi:hypothetical protein CDCA_CDCA09G2755 [Cyanidium caldarium]|uniref:Nuclear pore complex protein n=1 Tax=Cyanidium caldarium TaxID=2771 RepID=A0AAV9IXB5_CYACA|nr:hypothetical protein CDCA_CDCA09G2755 [Cyanidium caldarium]